MTRSEFKRLPVRVLRRMAYEMNILVPRDFTRQDILEEIMDRLGDDPVAWKLLDQYKEG